MTKGHACLSYFILEHRAGVGIHLIMSQLNINKIIETWDNEQCFKGILAYTFAAVGAKKV